MAYLRGNPYIWGDDEGLHIWQSDPCNVQFMYASGWAADQSGVHLAAVYLPNKTFDDLVVRRYAEMTEKQRRKAERRVGLAPAKGGR
jgi:hypothetical protein